MNDLNLFIVGIFEPMPTDIPNGDSCPDVSPKRFWWLHSRPTWHWHPIDFRTDPAAILMLMERMIDEYGIKSAFEAIWLRLLEYPTDGPRYSTLLKQATAEAFARAHGYTAEEQPHAE